MFSEVELIFIAILLDEEESKSRKRKRVHESLLQRKEEGEYFTLYKEVVEDSVRFHQYFRMSKSMYLNLLSLIEEDLMKKNTTFREDISPRKKLAVSLR
jgi:ssDNA-binding replication factor A large subunit